MKKITIFLSVLLSVFILAGCGGTKKERLEWPTDGIAKLLPNPNAKYGKINTNNEEFFSGRIEKQSKDDFKKYIKLLEKKGFNAEKQTHSDTNLTLYNKQGDKLNIMYWDKNYFDITLNKSVVSDKYTWPTMGLATLLPKPKSDYGKITTDSEDSFVAHIGKTTQQDFGEYINKVVEKGFTIDYSKSDKRYSAKDSKGNELVLYYEGFNTMEIHLSFSEDNKDTDSEEATTQSSSQSEQTQPSQQSTQQNNTTGIRPEVKEQIDAYEKFFDEYVAFMKKYKESNNAVSMAADYANFMKKYTDYMAKFENIDDKGWNDAEVAYWLEVNGRVMGKLATIQ